MPNRGATAAAVLKEHHRGKTQTRNQEPAFEHQDPQTLSYQRCLSVGSASLGRDSI